MPPDHDDPTADDSTARELEDIRRSFHAAGRRLPAQFKNVRTLASPPRDDRFAVLGGDGGADAPARNELSPSAHAERDPELDDGAALVPAARVAPAQAAGEARARPAALPAGLTGAGEKARPRWSRRLLVLGMLALGAAVGVGMLLGRVVARPRPAAAAPPVSIVTRGAPPPTSIVTRIVPQPVVRTVVPRSCLETATRGDQTIALLTANVRDRRLDDALKAYTLASQRCRHDASN